MVQEKVLYAFRGWLAFVAFMDLGVTFRSFFENKCILGTHSNLMADEHFIHEESTLPRVLGMFALLKAICLIHCSIFIHYKPIVSIGALSIIIFITMYLSEAMVYRSTTMNYFIIFPTVLNSLTLGGLVIIAQKINKPMECIEENVELLMTKYKYRKKKI
ncbi:uncharacterized protein LOC126900481 [Daktulosphaira vitifoliae]|uniref:uncharacterized protein LOC126900481 n=1 Tax=Daktulosphaira vitifoliae TaxID=58002 RepID=UPI0021AA6F7D|nr:uncharacterized protein LOC126900481 [Daktulosphaira vitifoliae]